MSQQDKDSLQRPGAKPVQGEQNYQDNDQRPTLGTKRQKGVDFQDQRAVFQYEQYFNTPEAQAYKQNYKRQQEEKDREIKQYRMESNMLKNDRWVNSTKHKVQLQKLELKWEKAQTAMDLATAEFQKETEYMQRKAYNDAISEAFQNQDLRITLLEEIGRKQEKEQLIEDMKSKLHIQEDSNSIKTMREQLRADTSQESRSIQIMEEGEGTSKQLTPRTEQGHTKGPANQQKTHARNKNPDYSLQTVGIRKLTNQKVHSSSKKQSTQARLEDVQLQVHQGEPSMDAGDQEHNSTNTQYGSIQEPYQERPPSVEGQSPQEPQE